jgi:hypothetical protein
MRDLELLIALHVSLKVSTQEGKGESVLQSKSFTKLGLDNGKGKLV